MASRSARRQACIWDFSASVSMRTASRDMRRLQGPTIAGTPRPCTRTARSPMPAGLPSYRRNSNARPTIQGGPGVLLRSYLLRLSASADLDHDQHGVQGAAMLRTEPLAV